ncbi:MAG: SPOR domain-containing protein [Pseudomonadota bacterium]|nr:SPOR domain-containing protein [Pseudomonadota bacterium]
MDSAAQASAPSAARSIPTGPAADYPMVLGEPFTIDGITYTPADTYNYDEVGYATFDDDTADGITVAHRTLPMPSYVEITSLESGRTILARVERRGPMTNTRLLGLSRAAAAQLGVGVGVGVGEGAPVRVRRVNPPEDQRAELRADRSVDPRMETPQGLLDVLKRQLPEVGSVSLAKQTSGARTGAGGDTPRAPIETIDPTTQIEPAPTEARPTPSPVPAPSPASSPASSAATEDVTPPAPAATPAARGDFAVQAGAYSSRASAQKVADAIGGYLEPAGSLFRVRVGPFANRGEAASALAKVRGAGYRDAQIVTTR